MGTPDSYGQLPIVTRRERAQTVAGDGCGLVGLELVPVVALDQFQTPQLVLEFREVG